MSGSTTVAGRAVQGAGRVAGAVGRAVGRNAIPAARAVAGIVGTALAAKEAYDLYNNRSFMASQYQTQITYPIDLIQGDARSYYIAFEFQKYQKRAINDSPFLRSEGKIRLPIPDNLKDVMSVSYTPENLGAGPGAALEGLAGGSVTQAGLGVLAGAATEAIAGLTGQYGKALQAYTGMAVNQYQTILFEKPEFKSHTFNWKLMPRNEEESNRIRNLIRTFQYHMSPGVDPRGNGLFFSYPSMAIISLFPTSEFLYRFKPCVVKNVTVNYAAGSAPSFFKRVDGAPVAITMSIQLQEIEYWTNKDFLGDVFSDAIQQQNFTNFQARNGTR